MSDKFAVFWTVLVSLLVMQSSVEEVDDSATLDYLYYNVIDPGISMLDQTFSSFNFDPDKEWVFRFWSKIYFVYMDV